MFVVRDDKKKTISYAKDADLKVDITKLKEKITFTSSTNMNYSLVAETVGSASLCSTEVVGGILSNRKVFKADMPYFASAIKKQVVEEGGKWPCGFT